LSNDPAPPNKTGRDASVSPESLALLNKGGQLSVVLLGFFCSSLGLMRGFSGAQSVGEFLVSLLFLIGLAVRYWWVILLLPWPFSIARSSLLLLQWAAALSLVQTFPSPRRWLLSLASVAFVGFLTEVYNDRDGQWRVKNTALAASLRRDHRIGIGAALTGSLAIAAASLYLPDRFLIVFAAVMTMGDWVRLTEMVGRHRRLML
jgi:hypothetical protein